MLTEFYSRLGIESPVAPVVLSIGLMLFIGFFMTRVTKLLRLPNVTAYILTGILLGPFCLNAIPMQIAENMEFVSDIALAFIAFSAGEFFRLTALRSSWKKWTVITVMESLGAAACVFLVTCCILHVGLPFAIILAALSSATAPASTLMTIRQTGAKGDFVETLLSVVAMDDVVSLLAFSVAIAIASAGNGFSGKAVLYPLGNNVLMIAAGAAMGWILKRLMTAGRSTDNRLIVALALLFGLCGLGAALSVSPLLGCMVFGMTYINLTDDSRLFKQLNYFSPPILLLFFVKSGLTFRLDALVDRSYSIGRVSLFVIGILYFVVRIVGKYAGAWLGCHVTKKAVSVRNYLGLALIPQAGVAIGLAALGARLLGGETGQMLQTIILSSSILYELVGPACAKAALYLSGSYESALSSSQEQPSTQTDPISELRNRLQRIQEEIRTQEYARSEEELAFTQAATEDEEMDSGYWKPYGNRNTRYRR